MSAFLKLGLLGAFLALVFSACDSDPFGLRRTSILGAYELEISESGTYFYLVGPEPLKAYGVLEGTVGRIGWNERYILVYQNPDGLEGGWKIVDTENEVASGIRTDDEIAQDIRVNKVQTQTPEQVWNARS